MQPILFILGIRPCLEAIRLLETLFNSAAPGTLSGRLRRIPVRDGVRAWDFDCALSLPSPLPAAPQNRYQILFCRSGALRVELAVGKQLFLHEREVLLLAPGATLARASVPDGRLAGGLVVVEVRRNDSLQNVLGSLLGGLTLDAVRLEERLNARSGCALLRGTPWTETVFSALQPLQPEARGRYCAFKTAELLYLLSTDSPLLPLPPEAPGRDRYQVELMRQVRDHMLAHLADPLTINQLSARPSAAPVSARTSRPPRRRAAERVQSLHRGNRLGGRLQQRKPVRRGVQAPLSSDALAVPPHGAHAEVLILTIANFATS